MVFIALQEGRYNSIFALRDDEQDITIYNEKMA